MTTQQAIGAYAFEQLRRTFRGQLITPGDLAYDNARRMWNAIHDRRPAVIAQAVDAGDVATAVAFGREHDLEIVVRSGGHSHADLTGVPGCLVIDLSAMNGVEIQPEARIARVNGGALLGELDVAAQAHGLVCPVGVIGHTGVAGLTLGGGTGRLQRRFGLTIDNLAAVELVTADGRRVRASAEEEPDLFWGLRGAGWNFGIATAFEFRLQPFAGVLHRGALIFPADHVRALWETLRESMPAAPDTVAAILGIDRAGPDSGYPDELVGKPIVYVTYNHSGEADDVERDTAALVRGPAPLKVTRSSQPYLEAQASHDLVLGWGSRSVIAGFNGDDVRPEALDEIVELVASAPGEGTFSITALGGAIGRVPEDATAYAGRAARFDVSADASWQDPSLDTPMRDWVARVMRIVEPQATLGRYANENSVANPGMTRAIYGDAHLERLAQLKRTWDPENVFHVNHNVAPA